MNITTIKRVGFAAFLAAAVWAAGSSTAQAQGSGFSRSFATGVSNGYSGSGFGVGNYGGSYGTGNYGGGFGIGNFGVSGVALSNLGGASFGAGVYPGYGGGHNNYGGGFNGYRASSPNFRGYSNSQNIPLNFRGYSSTQGTPFNFRGYRPNY